MSAPSSAPTAHVAFDRSDFRTVTLGGAGVGLVTGVAVVAFLAASQRVPETAGARGVVEALIVLAAGVLAAFLPATWTAPRGADGIAGAAAIGLVGTIVFSAIDIIVLRPFKAYPWTWDAIGGGSSWWYLPVWWMLGTFLAWMGGIVTAAAAPRGEGETTLARRAMPVVIATVIGAVVARLLAFGIALPVATGGAFTVAIAAFAIVALARKG
ncbi:MAG TPA: hypothetical protein VEU73_01560 [Gemmatimonadales bacterium]|nr:hypothetical protein [Gemmatimonadales bacterium]